MRDEQATEPWRGEEEAVVHRLGLRLVGAEPHREIRLLVDGRDTLGVGSFTTGNHPRELLGGGALVPTEPPRRIGLYGCACGIFGCGTLTALIERQEERILWRDFYDFCCGEYSGPFPDDPRWPDPLDDPEPDDVLVPRALELPDLAFDREQYVEVVRQASEGWAEAGGRLVEWPPSRRERAR